MAITILGPFSIQVAHRLTKLPGKCQNIHGHSMKVVVALHLTHDGDYFVDDRYEIVDFSAAKKIIREYLDNEYDHKLHLNEDDPWAGNLFLKSGTTESVQLPGLQTHRGDPSVENIAFWIAQYLNGMFSCYIEVTVHETDTNAVVSNG